MKQPFLLFIFIISTTLVFCQSTDWKSFDTPNKNSVNLIYQSKDGYLFGSMSDSYQLVFSEDKGDSWSALGDITIYYLYNNIPFKEDKAGNIYFYSKNIIYKFDKPNKKFFEFIVIDDYNNIEDIGILYTGDIVVAHFSELILYSSTGVKKKNHEWWTHSATFLTGEDQDSKNYVTNSHGASDELWEFSPDFSYIGNTNNTIGYRNLLRIGDRLISDDQYSDDGGETWKKFSQLAQTNIHSSNIGADGRLYLNTQNKIFISSDAGETFTVIYTAISGNIKYVSAYNNFYFISSIWDCNYRIHRSGDNGISWDKLKNDIGYYQAGNVIPAINENLYTTFCGFSQKENEFSPWETVDVDEDPSGTYYTEIIHPLSDNSLLAYADNHLFKSNDGGKSWVKQLGNELYSFYEYGFTEKDRRIFHLEYDSVLVSDDFGKTWNSFGSAPGIFFLYYKIEFTKKMDMYFYDDINGVIIRYNLETQERVIINNNGEDFVFRDFCTAYNNDNFYVLEKKSLPDRLILNISIDKGQSFISKPVGNFIHNDYYRLKTDHLGNIYVFSETSLLISSDQGSSWQNITPDFPELVSINDLQISYDNYIYLATTGMGILKYKPQLSIPNQLKVVVFDDLNQNCIKDVNEPPVKNVKVVVNGNFLSQVDENGETSFYLHKKDNVVTLEFNETLYSTCETSYSANFDGSTNNITLDIPLKAKRYCVDLKSGISTPFLRRCFDNTYNGTICNDGNIDAENVKVKITLDEFFDFVSVSLPIISQTDSELILDAGTIESGDCKNITLKINVSCDAALGQEHCIEMDAVTSSQECDGVDSRESYVDCQPNIGSFDPNDKSIFVNGVRGQDYVEPGDKMEYMIRFQNTGTDTAFTVKIQDPISSKFDIASIRPVAASHEYSWSLENGTLKVVFNNIMLVDSFKNEANSHGFIKFEIELHKDTKLNESLSNVAGIYFDFNEPVITNTVTTPIGKPVSSQDLVSAKVAIFPNPTSDFITIKVNDTGFAYAKITVYNSTGSIVLSDHMTASAIKMDVSQLLSGYYLVSVVSKAGEYKVGFVKI